MLNEMKRKETRNGTEAFDKVVADIHRAKPLFKEVGYVLSHLVVETGVVPKVIGTFRHLFEVDDYVFDDLLQHHENHKVVIDFLSNLRQANHLHRRLRVKGLTFYQVEVEFGGGHCRLHYYDPAVHSLQPEQDSFSVDSQREVSKVPLALKRKSKKGRSKEEERRRKNEKKQLELGGEGSGVHGALDSAEETIKFRCPGCKKTLEVRTSAAGQLGRCRQCGTLAVVPSAGGNS
jgi:hypothetical protein